MSTIKSSSEHLTLNADGAAKEIKLQANGVEKAKVTSTGIDVTGRITTDGITEDSSGNVGIGTSSPDVFSRGYTRTVGITSSGSTSLAIQSAGDPQYPAIEMGRGASRQFMITNEAAYSTIGTLENTPLRFLTNSSERMRIDSGGQIGIGTTSVTVDGHTVHIKSLGNSKTLKSEITTTADASHFYFDNPNGTVGSIGTNGTTTSYYTASDYRLKENVEPMTGSIDRLKELKPSRFNFIVDADTTVDGFLAHEVSDIVSEAVTGEKDAMRDEEYEVSPALGEIYTPAIEEITDEEGNVTQEAVAEAIISSDVEQPETLEDGQQWRETTSAEMGTRTVPDYQGIDQAKLVPLLTSALQEAVAKIETLETTVADLTTRIEALEA